MLWIQLSFLLICLLSIEWTRITLWVSLLNWTERRGDGELWMRELLTTVPISRPCRCPQTQYKTHVPVVPILRQLLKCFKFLPSFCQHTHTHTRQLLSTVVSISFLFDIANAYQCCYDLGFVCEAFIHLSDMCKELGWMWKLEVKIKVVNWGRAWPWISPTSLGKMGPRGRSGWRFRAQEVHPGGPMEWKFVAHHTGSSCSFLSPLLLILPFFPGNPISSVLPVTITVLTIPEFMLHLGCPSEFRLGVLTSRHLKLNFSKPTSSIPIFLSPQKSSTMFFVSLCTPTH